VYFASEKHVTRTSKTPYNWKADNSSKAAVALSVEAVAGMVYFSGRNTTVSDTLVPLVFGM
jgi:hypothetical protein